MAELINVVVDLSHHNPHPDFGEATVDGIGKRDRDKLNGSEAELRALWGYGAPAMV